MDTNKHELLLKDEVYQIVGCAMEVLNTLGHGLLEKPYENAFCVECGLLNFKYAKLDALANSVIASEAKQSSISLTS